MNRDRTCASMRHPSPCRDKTRHLTTELSASVVFRLICGSQVRSKFVVDFSILSLLISLFSITCIFRSLDLASSVSASNVVCMLSLFLLYSGKMHIEGNVKSLWFFCLKFYCFLISKCATCRPTNRETPRLRAFDSEDILFCRI